MRTGAARWIGCCGLGTLLAVTGCADKPEEPVDVGVAVGSVFPSNDLPGGTQLVVLQDSLHWILLICEKYVSFVGLVVLTNMTSKLACPTAMHSYWLGRYLGCSSQIIDISCAKRCYSGRNRLGAVV